LLEPLLEIYDKFLGLINAEKQTNGASGAEVNEPLDAATALLQDELKEFCINNVRAALMESNGLDMALCNSIMRWLTYLDIYLH
jgi:hypothetical protein